MYRCILGGLLYDGPATLFSVNIPLVAHSGMIRRSLVQALRDEGHAVDWVTERLPALAALAAPAGHQALVRIDGNLPKVRGLEELRDLRANGLLTPVLMVTAREDPREFVRGLNAGTDDDLQKAIELLAFQAHEDASFIELRRGHAGPLDGDVEPEGTDREPRSGAEDPNSADPGNSERRCDDQTRRMHRVARRRGRRCERSPESAMLA